MRACVKYSSLFKCITKYCLSKQIEPLHSIGVPKRMDKALYISAVSKSLGTLVLCKGSILCFESKKLIQKLQKRF